jgi:BMFP domain-containing protein YqiC
MLSQKLFDEISAKIGDTLASSPAKDLEKNLRSLMGSAFTKLDLVTREEFDVQQEVLARTREKLEQLEARLAKLEALVLPPQAAAEAAPVEAEAEQAVQGHS